MNASSAALRAMANRSSVWSSYISQMPVVGDRQLRVRLRERRVEGDGVGEEVNREIGHQRAK